MALIDDASTEARLQGYSWDEINDHVDDSTQQALAQGYSQEQVDAHLGYQDPRPLQDHLASLAAHPTQPIEPLPEPSPDGEPQPVDDPRLHQAYAEALGKGLVKDPQEFADHVADATGSSPEAAKAAASSFPAPQEFIDHAIALVHDYGIDRMFNPVQGLREGMDLIQTVLTAKDNLLHLYGETGQTPAEVRQTLDPVTGEVLTLPQEQYRPTTEQLNQQGFEKPIKEHSAFKDMDAIMYGVPGFVRSLYNLPGDELDFRQGIAKMREEGKSEKEIAEAERDDPAKNVFAGLVLGSVGGWALKGTSSGIAHLPSATDIARNMDEIWKDESGTVKIKRGEERQVTEAQMKATEEKLAGKILVWKDGRYQAIPQPPSFDKIMEGAVDAGMPGAKQTELGLERPLQPQDIEDAIVRARASPPEARGLPGAKEQPLGLDRPLQPEDKAIREQMMPSENAGMLGARQDTLDIVHPLQPRDIADQIVRARMEAADYQRGMAGAKEQALGLDRPAQPQEIADAIARHRMEAAEYQRGMAGAKEQGLPIERPLQPEDVSIREQRPGAEPDKALAKAKDQALGLERPLQPEDVAIKKQTPGAELQPRIMTPEEHATQTAAIKEQADKIGIKPPKPPEIELPVPKEITLSSREIRRTNRDLDDTLNRLNATHEVNLRRIQEATDRIPPEWHAAAFQEKVQKSQEARQQDPTHQHSPEVQAFLDMTKDMADKRTKLAREHAELTGQDPDSVLTAEQGHAPHVKIGEEKPLQQGDPNYERRDVIAGGGGGRGFTKTADSMVENHAYVWHDPVTGERHWGGLDNRKDGVEFGQKKSGDMLDGKMGGVAKPATPGEIEANTPYKFNKNYWSNLTSDVANLSRTNDHIKFLGSVMKEVENAGLWTKDEAAAHPGWKAVEAPQIKGFADPRIADTLNSFYRNGEVRGGLWDFLGRASRYLMRTLFISPAVHIGNVGAHWAVGRGLDWFHPMGYWRGVRTGAQAIHDVWTLSDRYLNTIENGAGHQYLSTQTSNFHQTLFQQGIKDVLANPSLWTSFLGAVKLPGYAAVDLANAMYRQSSRALWLMNDVFLQQRILELQDSGTTMSSRVLGRKVTGAAPMDIREAIFRAEKDIPNYRIPSQIMGSQPMAEFMKSPVLMNFGRYRYGQVRALALTVNDLVAPEGGLTAGKAFGAADRLDAVAKLALLYFGAQVGYPVVNSALQQMASSVTGGADWAKNLVLKAMGPFSLLHAVGQVKGFTHDTKSWAAGMASFMTWGKALEAGQVLTSGKDSFTGKDIVTAKTPLGKATQVAEAVAKEIPITDMLMNLGKKGGLSKTLANLMGGDVEKPLLDQSKQAQFDRMADAASAKRENADDIETWLRTFLSDHGINMAAPQATAASGGGRAATGGYMGSGAAYPKATGGYVGTGQRAAAPQAYDSGGIVARGGTSSPASTGGARSSGRSGTGRAPYARGRYYRGGSRRRAR